MEGLLPAVTIVAPSVLFHSPVLAFSTAWHSGIILWWSRTPPSSLVKTVKTLLQYISGGMLCLL